MTSFTGHGRTGNNVISLRVAIELALACKKVIEMPRADDNAQAFKIDISCHIMDFSRRSGPEDSFCVNVTFPIQGDARFFWFFQETVPTYVKEKGTWPILEEHMIAKSSIDVVPCLRVYLGICSPQYCEFEFSHPMHGNKDNILVAHLREGDVFKQNFSSQVSYKYGQPPLSYYLRAIHSRRWHSILVVSQPGNVGPIRSGLLMLNQTMQTQIRLQISSWYDDLRTVLCAPALVTSKSSLEGLFSLGFALQIFGYRCLGTSQLGKDYYRIPVHSYSPFSKHTNSPTEWVETLLHSSPPPEKC